MYIEIEKIANDGLSSAYYEFYITADYRDSIPIRLNAYQARTKPTKRHGWRVGNKYHRLMQGASNLNRADVPIPDTIISEAISLAASKIVWKDV